MSIRSPDILAYLPHVPVYDVVINGMGREFSSFPCSVLKEWKATSGKEMASRAASFCLSYVMSNRGMASSYMAFPFSSVISMLAEALAWR